MKVVYSGTELNDAKTLMDYPKLTKEATLNLVMQPRPGMKRSMTPASIAALPPLELPPLGLRMRADEFHGKFKDYNRQDGWATVQGIDVEPIRKFLLDCADEDNDDEDRLLWHNYGSTG